MLGVHEPADVLVPGLGHGHAHHPHDRLAAQQGQPEPLGKARRGLVVEHRKLRHQALGSFEGGRRDGIDQDQFGHGAGVGRHEVAGDDRPERMPQQDRVRAQAQRGHEAAEETAVGGNAVLGSLEGGRAAEARQVRHDQAHVRQLVGHPEQAVVVAAEPVHHQDGAGLRGDLGGFVDPVRDPGAVNLDGRGPGAGVESAAEQGRA